jgi:hypothetical protein
MAIAETIRVSPVSQPFSPVRWIEKYFYLCMSLLIAAVIIYGFSQTIDRRLIHPKLRPPILLTVHAILFSAWVAFYVLQSVLVRVRKVRIHRILGWAGAALGACMIVVGPWVAVVMARFDTVQLHRPNRDGLAILWSANAERHRRLMLIASCVLTGAAFGRMPLMHGALYFYGGVDGLILLGVLRDLAVNRRIHAVYLIAIPALVVAQTAISQIFLHRASFWIRIAHGLLS